MRWTCLLVAALFTLVPLNARAQDGAGPETAGDWLQWGGPHRNFMVDSRGLAESWPEGGPRRLWSRELGEGYSAILVQGDVLYTLYRDGEREVVVSLAADSGETRWEFVYDAPTEGWRFDRGAGPHSTPAVGGELIFAVGATAKLHAVKQSDGSPVWSHDLMQELSASFRHRGYSSSPLVYGGTVIVAVGGEGKALVAFHQADGSIAWQSGDDDNSYSSPILIELGGEVQLVVFGATRIQGLDPQSGKTLWSHPHPTRSAFNISTPVWCPEGSDEGVLFVSSAYDGGGRAVALRHHNGSTVAEELWFSNQVRVHFGTAIRLGDAVYASSGDFGPAPLTAVDLRSGEVLWRDRSFSKASLLYADEKVIVLDEDGVLGLVQVSRQGLQVLARAQVFDSLAWTVPTLVGSRLYLRNREEVMALDLGK